MESLKILFVGDASNFHNTLANALTRLGHKCVVASNGSKWMNNDREINLDREAGILGLTKYIYQIASNLHKMRGFDIVHISNPIFLNLRPERVKYVFDFLRKNNKHIFLSALGTDYQYVNACYNKHTFKYSDYFIGDKVSPYMQSKESKHQSNWREPFMRDYHKYIIDNIDGIMACLYEYYVAYKGNIPNENLCYGGIPIDTKKITPHYIESEPERVKFFIGIQKNRTILKGTDKLLEAAKAVQQTYPHKCEIEVVQNVPYKEYIQRMTSSHVILDQLYSYTPATNALDAMAQGMIAVSGAEPEYYDFIGERENKPIINVSPLIENDIYNKLEWLVNNKQELPRLSIQSREFVVKHNDSELVAKRHLEFWNKFIQL